MQAKNDGGWNEVKPVLDETQHSQAKQQLQNVPRPEKPPKLGVPWLYPDEEKLFYKEWEKS